MMNQKHKTIPIFVSNQGCPQNCLFCDQKKISGQQEVMTASKVKQIIEDSLKHKNEGDIFEIGFFGGSFTGIPLKEQEAFLSVAYEYVKTGQVSGIRLSTRPDYISDTIVRRLCSYGVKCIELGAQSMDDEILEISRRGHRSEQTRQAAQIIRDHGLALGLQMMIGLPKDSYEKTIKTAKSFVEMGASCVRIYPTLVIRDTALAELYKTGNYHPLSLNEAVRQTASLYQLFCENKIDVIRMGLLSMKKEDILAGPFHPAFGELVLSEVFYQRLSEALKKAEKKDVKIRINPKDLSAVLGHARVNITRLKESGLVQKFIFETDEAVFRGNFEIQNAQLNCASERF